MTTTTTTKKAAKAAKAATTTKAAAAAKPAAAAPAIDAGQLAAALGFVSKVAEREFVRDDVADGSHHEIAATLVVTVDGQAQIVRNWEGTVDTGYSHTKADSIGAKAAEVLAYVANKLSARKRAELYVELAEVYAANGHTLPVTDEAVAEAEEAMSRLGQTRDKTYRGNFRATPKPQAMTSQLAAVVGKRQG